MSRKKWNCLGLLVAVVGLTTGCNSACSEAEDLCVECGIDPQRCEAQFEDVSEDVCEEQVESYRANCTEVEQ
ncbi:MAG: hypothetical protein AAGA56_18510 [Myxococcota bacterium]